MSDPMMTTDSRASRADCSSSSGTPGEGRGGDLREALAPFNITSAAPNPRPNPPPEYRRRGQCAILVLAILSLLGPALRAEPSANNGSKKDVYQIVPLPTPDTAVMEVGGMDWMPDGRLMVCTRRGEVWAMSHSLSGEIEWKLFATGLQEALGILHGDKGEVYVMQRPELTRLVDTNNDGVADKYETVNADFGFSGNYHEFAYGPVRDKDGNFLISLNLSHAPDAFGGPFMGAHPETPYRGWTARITADGKFVPFSNGMRSPNGLSVAPDGEIFYSDNQGEWMASNMLFHVKQGAFYGNPSSLIFEKDWNNRDPKKVPLEELDKRRVLPAVVFPYGRMGQSLAQACWDTTGGKFGPFAGQIFIGDITAPIVMRATLEKVDGDYQGACYPFMKTDDLRGANRILFAPDGSMYVGLTDRGWGKGTQGIQQIKWTGKTPFEIQSMSLTKTGFDLTFTKPVDKATASRPETYQLLHWHLIYHHDYGSPEADKTPVKISEVKISADGKTVSLALPELVAKKVYDLTVTGLKAADGGEDLRNNTAYYTLNRLRAE